MNILSYILHAALLLFLILVLIGLGYWVRDGIRDWRAQRNLNNHLRHIEMMRRWKN